MGEISNLSSLNAINNSPENLSIHILENDYGIFYQMLK